MRQKKAVTKELKDRYQRSSKKGKTHILNEFIQLTRYHRSYASRTLRIKKVLGYMNIAGKRIKYVADNRKIKRKKTKIYDMVKEIAVVKKFFIFFLKIMFTLLTFLNVLCIRNINKKISIQVFIKA